MENNSPLNDFISVVATEVQRNNMGPAIDISKCKEKIYSLYTITKSKLDPNSLDKIDSYVKNINVTGKIVSFSLANIKNIIKDGKIDLNDTSYFLDIIAAIQEQANTINQENVTLKINSNDLIELCGLFLKIILIFTVEDPIALDSSIKITNSAIGLLRFSMKKTSWSFKCCC